MPARVRVAEVSPPTPFRDTKARVLRLLKTRRSATAAQLADALGVTRACVHTHLADLSGAGLVRLRRVLRAGRGRPGHVYELTEAGEHCFPKDYAGLALDVLEQVRTRWGEGAVLELLTARHQTQARRWREELAGEGLEARLHGLAERLCSSGYEAEVTTVSGERVLVLSNCPCPAVAECHPELCAAEQVALETALGAALRRDKRRIVDGGGGCRYHMVSYVSPRVEPEAA